MPVSCHRDNNKECSSLQLSDLKEVSKKLKLSIDSSQTLKRAIIKLDGHICLNTFQSSVRSLEIKTSYCEAVGQSGKRIKKSKRKRTRFGHGGFPFEMFELDDDAKSKALALFPQRNSRNDDGFADGREHGSESNLRRFS